MLEDLVLDDKNLDLEPREVILVGAVLNGEVITAKMQLKGRWRVVRALELDNDVSGIMPKTRERIVSLRRLR